MRFRWSFLPALAAIVSIVVTIVLGNWQSGRAQSKAQLQQRIEQAMGEEPIVLDPALKSADSIAYHRIQTQGRLLTTHTIFLDNRVRKGVAGYEVITPLALTGEKAVAINRGWMAAPLDRSILPNVDTPLDVVKVIGVALPPSTRFVELSRDTIAGRVWQNLDLDRYARHTGLELVPAVIQLHSDVSDGLGRQWPRPDLGVDRHRAYALQWYAMSAAIFLLYLFLNVRRTA